MALRPRLLAPINNDYIIGEFDKLNKELESLLTETRSREKYSLAIIAGVSVWVYTNLDKTSIGLLKLVSLIPLATTVIYGISTLMLYFNIKWIGKYLMRIEQHFLPGNPKGFGWESYFRKANNKSLFVVSTIVFWVFQLGLGYMLCYIVRHPDMIKMIKGGAEVTAHISYL